MVDGAVLNSVSYQKLNDPKWTASASASSN